MKTPQTTAPPLLMLPRLASLAGLPVARAQILWTRAWQETAGQAGASAGDRAGRAVDRLLALLGAESRCLDRKHVLRPWHRLQRRLLGLQLAWWQASTTISNRALRQCLGMESRWAS